MHELRAVGRRHCLMAGLGLVALAAAGRAAAASDIAAAPLPEWRSASGRGHPLVGVVFDPAARRRLAPAEGIDRLRHADFVLLGEKHDNADHHRLQAWVIEAMVKAGRRPAVALEMISVDQAQALSDWRMTVPSEAAGLGPAIGWEHTGWPDWSNYLPIADAALKAGLPLIAADVPKGLQRLVSRSGLDSVEPVLAGRLGLAMPYDTAQAASLRAEIEASHCGHAREEMIRPMSDVQRLRDAHFAAAMIAAAQNGADGAVLIAGAGHARADRGVPWHLRRLAPGRSARTLAFVEVDDARLHPEQYRTGADSTTAPFDLLWFTPRVEDVDPCEKFAESLRRMRERRSP